MLPPPADTVATSSIGRCSGCPAMTVELRAGRLAVGHERHVARRAAHVEGEGEPALLARGQARRADDASGGAAQHGPGRVLGRLGDRQHSAARLHDRRRREPRRRRPLGQAAEIGAQHRGEVGVDDRRRDALVLADLRAAPRWRRSRGRPVAPPAARRRRRPRAPGCANENSSPTAIASEPSAATAATARSSEAGSRGVVTPCGPQRSATSWVRSCGTSGGGWWASRR